MVSAILTSPPHSSTVSNFNSTSSTIDRAMAEDGSKYSESVSPQVMDDMPISLSARAIPLAKDPYVTPTSTLADPSGPVDAELMDQLDDMRQVLQNTITRTNNQLQGLKKSQQQDKAETPEQVRHLKFMSLFPPLNEMMRYLQLQKVIGSYESLYKQVLASELVHWQVFFRQLTDSEAKGVNFNRLHSYCLRVLIPWIKGRLCVISKFTLGCGLRNKCLGGRPSLFSRGLIFGRSLNQS